MALRKCVDCGLEAHTKSELEKFRAHNECKYGRQNLCKTCRNKRVHEKGQNSRHNLRKRFYDMKARCYNPNHQAYSNYGERGITVCQEWLDSPDAFIEWALDNGFQIDLQIDRIDNSGEYSPDNCRWVTSIVQNRNTRANVTDFEKGTRICCRCGIEKALDEFYPLHRTIRDPEERAYLCKACQAQSKRRAGRERGP